MTKQTSLSMGADNHVHIAKDNAVALCGVAIFPSALIEYGHEMCDDCQRMATSEAADAPSAGTLAEGKPVDPEDAEFNAYWEHLPEDVRSAIAWLNSHDHKLVGEYIAKLATERDALVADLQVATAALEAIDLVANNPLPVASESNLEVRFTQLFYEESEIRMIIRNALARLESGGNDK